MLEDVRHDYIRTNDVTLHVVSAGPEDGPFVILLHGFPEFWYGWRHQIPFLASAGYQVWAPDQRGYNLSEKPVGAESYNLDRVAGDVTGLIKAAGRKKAYLVGHDWGGEAAWWTALRYPESVDKLVALNAPHPVVMRRYASEHWSQRLKSWYVGAFQVPYLPERILRQDNFEVLTELLNATAREGSFSDEELIQYQQAWARPRALTSMINWYRALPRSRTEPLESIRVQLPTLVIWGEHDVALDTGLAPASIELCDNGYLELMKEATHWVQHDEPFAVNDLLVTFLR